MNTRSFVLSALIAGAAIGVLANLPVLNLINCFLCLWVWIGGLLAVFLTGDSSTASQVCLAPRELAWEPCLVWSAPLWAWWSNRDQFHFYAPVCQPRPFLGG